jgi:hypothetical protein
MKTRSCEAAFRKAVNMTPAQIRAWQKNPAAKTASLPKRKKTGKGARAELTMIARMLKKPGSKWTAAEHTKACDTVAFIGRHTKQMGSKCQPTRIKALRNWGRETPRCSK